jgi:RNA ligase (TIGR02306 family)
MPEHVEVFKIDSIFRVPGLDNLGLVHFYGYDSLVLLKDFVPGDLAAYIPPDFIVPDTPEYTFMGSSRRVKARRFKGIWSQGLVVAAPHGSRVGDDVTAQMGIVKYTPRLRGESNSGYGKSKSRKWFKYNSFIEGPPSEGPYYDIESWYRHSNHLNEGETVLVTEKLHGTNARFTFQDDTMWVASRSGYRRDYNTPLTMWEKFKLLVSYGWKGFKRWTPETTVYWQAVYQNSWIIDICEANPGVVFYGEIYGDVQHLKYGAEQGEYKIALFDAFYKDAFLDDMDFLECLKFGLNNSCTGCYNIRELIPPLLYYGPYDKSKIEPLISGYSLVKGANHIREGIVIKPVKERKSNLPGLGRVILKAVSPAYLEKAPKEEETVTNANI